MGMFHSPSILNVVIYISLLSLATKPHIESLPPKFESFEFSLPTKFSSDATVDLKTWK